VFPRNYTKTTDIIAAVSAAGYSQYRVNLFSVLVWAGLLASPLNIHKLKFWSGNLKHITVAVHLNHPEYLQKYSNNTYICSEMVMNHKFSDKYMCLFDIMTTIYLAQVHNLSLNMIDGKGLFIIPNQFTEVIGPSQNYIDSHLLFPFKQTGVTFSYRQSSKIIYCPKTNLVSKPWFAFSVWIEPFPVNLWIMFIISFVLIPYIMFANGFGNKLEGIFALLSWQSVSRRNGKVVIILSFSAMFVSISYSNEITSLMVIPSMSKPIQNLKELLDAGYKLVVSGAPLWITMETHKQDFRLFNISDRLNSSFHNVPNIEDTSIARDFLADTKTKFATIKDENLEFVYRNRFGSIVNHQLKDGTIKCLSVHESIRPVSVLRIFYTVNRYWMFKTLQRIKHAGLDAKWKEVFDWENYHTEKIGTRGLVDGGIGLIEMTKFAPILALWALVGALAFIIFIFEASPLLKTVPSKLFATKIEEFQKHCTQTGGGFSKIAATCVDRFT